MKFCQSSFFSNILNLNVLSPLYRTVTKFSLLLLFQSLSFPKKKVIFNQHKIIATRKQQHLGLKTCSTHYFIFLSIFFSWGWQWRKKNSSFALQIRSKNVNRNEWHCWIAVDKLARPRNIRLVNFIFYRGLVALSSLKTSFS